MMPSSEDARFLTHEWKLWSSAEAELRVNPPTVQIDNTCSSEATVITVDSANRSGVLLEVVQTLTEMNMTIPKAIISSDGGWFVDVFHVTTEDGKKITDSAALQRIEKMLASEAPAGMPGWHRASMEGGSKPGGNYAVIELSVLDRPGLLSDVTHLLGSQGLSVISAATWTQHTRAALVIFVERVASPSLAKSSSIYSATGDPTTVSADLEGSTNANDVDMASFAPESVPGGSPSQPLLNEHLLAVRSLIETQLGANASLINVGLIHDLGAVNLDQRLHKVLTTPVASLHGYTPLPSSPSLTCLASSVPPNTATNLLGEDQAASEPALVHCSGTAGEEDVSVDIDNNMFPGYSLVTVKCLDRSALLFDTVCVLFVSDFDINHATIEATDGWAEMEFYVRTKAGHAIQDQDMQDTLKNGLLGACQRRGSGFRLELSSHDRPGLLADVTKKLADSGLTITKAQVGRNGDHAVEKFLVEGSKSHQIDSVRMRKVCLEIGQTLLEGGHVQVDQNSATLKTRKPSKSSESVLETWIKSGWA